jgi:hypothetical protein
MWSTGLGLRARDGWWLLERWRILGAAHAADLIRGAAAESGNAAQTNATADADDVFAGAGATTGRPNLKSPRR